MTPTLPLEDIQGIILRGYGKMAAACFILCQVERGRDAAAWLAGLRLTHAQEAEDDRETSDRFLNVALTHAGLVRLSSDPALPDRFPREFVEGPNTPERARTLGDLGGNASHHWVWGQEGHEPHVALLLYAATEAALPKFRQELETQALQAGLRIIHVLETLRLPGRKEHFGFRDGIAQPVIAGSGREEPVGNTVPAGEVLLGHPNAFGNLTHAPAGRDDFPFGLNGSYLVLRTLHQDVPAFWRFCRDQCGPGAASSDPVVIASKLVGRWPSGASLALHPDRDPGAAFEDEDGFGYAQSDPQGRGCPFGSHVRRSNPRDWNLGPTPEVANTVANRHRMIRRGRAYGPPLVPGLDPAGLLQACDEPGTATERGLHFLSFQGSIERQFEFVQQQWCGNPNFAGLHAEPDPLLGNPAALPAGTCPVFTIPAEPVRHRLGGLTRFVTVRGAAYFFMPSLSAMRSLGQSSS